MDGWVDGMDGMGWIGWLVRWMEMVNGWMDGWMDGWVGMYGDVYIVGWLDT